MHFEIAADIMSDRLLGLFCNAPKGFLRLEIGLQTLNEQTLTSINRKTDTKRLKANIKRLTESGNLHIHLDLIAGLPHEDLNSFIASFNGVMALQPDVLQLGILKLLPGAPMADNPQGVFNVKPPYEVIETPWLTKGDIEELLEIDYALDKIYNSGRFSETLSAIEQFNTNPYMFFNDLCTKQRIIRGESYNEIAQKILDSCTDETQKGLVALAMQKDMKRVNPVGRLPNFLKIKK